MAYSLMGIFGVNMPILHGEGEEAFIRLQQKIMQFSDDETIFAWRSRDLGHPQKPEGLLTRSPSWFQGSSGFLPSIYFHRTSPTVMTYFGLHFTNFGLNFAPYIAYGQDWLICPAPGRLAYSCNTDYLGVLNCKVDGKGPVLISLIRTKDQTHNQFLRVGTHQLWFWTQQWTVKSYNELQSDIFVRQKSLSLINRRKEESQLFSFHFFASASLRNKVKLVEWFPRHGWDLSSTFKPLYEVEQWHAIELEKMISTKPR